MIRKLLLMALALMSWVAAMAQQQDTESKPQLYIFSAQWCAPCQRMHQEALEHPEVVALIERMEYHPVDMEFTKDAEALYRKHARSGGVPELVMYDGKGKLIAREMGYTTMDGLLRFLRKAFSEQQLKQIEATRKRGGNR